MSRPAYGPTRVQRLPGLLAVFGLFFAAEIGLQVANRSHVSEFARTWDEGAHYVTGLMVREFIASGAWDSPIAFAEDYYLHYPKVAIGHWPPMFYLAQALWTLVFSPTRLSLMLFMAFSTALLATTLYLLLRRELGGIAGVAVGLLFLALPLVQEHGAAVMAEIPLALLALWAVLAFGRYLDTGAWRWSLAFGVLTSLAILTKANALALALVPPLGLLLTRDSRPLRRFSLWLPAIVVVGLCLPWYWTTFEMLRNALFVPFPHLASTWRAIPTYSRHLVALGGYGILLLSILGFWFRVIRGRRTAGRPGKWAALASLGMATLVFHWIAPVDFDARHMILAAPAVLALAMAGLFEAGARLPARQLSPAARTSLVAVLAAVLFLAGTFRLPGSEWSGFAPLAERLLAEPKLQNSVFLVSSDSLGEGAFIAEVAQRQPRPRHVVLRGSKILATSGWVGSNYRLLYDRPEEIERLLLEIPVNVVVLDGSVPDRFRTPDQHLLLQAVRESPETWRPFGSFPIVRGGEQPAGSARVYTLNAPSGPSERRIELDLTEMLGRRVGQTEPPAPRPRD